MRGPTKKQRELLAKWAAVPLGTEVIVTRDNGQEVKTKMWHAPTMLGGHTPVGWFEDITGCYSLERVRTA